MAAMKPVKKPAPKTVRKAAKKAKEPVPSAAVSAGSAHPSPEGGVMGTQAPVMAKAPAHPRLRERRHFTFPPGYGDNRIVILARDP